MFPKILVILGPTASGKSDLAVKLAKKFNGEIVSADSRQVYRGLDLGTGKITKKEMLGVPHYLLDVISAKKIFSIHDFKIQAEKAMQLILEKKKVPIIVGGTGFYIQSIVDNIILPEVPPNLKLRKELSKKTTKELFLILAELDIRRAMNIDVKNLHRLVRAIEIATYLGYVPEETKNKKYNSLQIGIDLGDVTLKEKVYKRIISRLKKGMITEVRNLHKKGLSWKRMEALGLEYRYISRFIRGRMTRQEMLEELALEIWHYVKRQRTWFKRDKRIKWHMPDKIKTIETEVARFLA